MAKKPEKKEADAPEGEEAQAGGGKKKLIIIGGAVGALLLIGGGAAFFLMGGKKEEAHGADPHAPAAAHDVKKETLFVELPEMTVNLSTVDSRATFLKVKIALEVSDKMTEEKIKPVLPRVLDAFQLYLRELRSSDLDGSAGLYRVKEELQRRINVAIYPAKIEAVLFKEILVQ
ncbi:flagellar basal body-associated FliL family protein [Methyloraptor flagellatus]|uniref:Flagellar protein FliL n=1 Tax=Methyloraptor flagellatus TaxID=3162530 RepID=A0AAU7XFB8_9HYPH